LIEYSNEKKISAEELSRVFKLSGINRPVDDLDRLKTMIDNASIIWTAWDNKKLIGVARALTDFSYACYLSDLAVVEDHQKQGIGNTLVEKLLSQIGPDVSLLLLAAPSALNYYPKLHFENITTAFLKKRRS